MCDSLIAQYATNDATLLHRRNHVPTKDCRPESRPERNFADERSKKATDPTIFDEQGDKSQTSGSQERDTEIGQFTDKGSPGYSPR